MFERAAREKFRFNSVQGVLTVEDLWDLPLASDRGNRANLDDIAKELNKQLKAKGDEESFVRPQEETDDTTTPVMFEIVKHIIKVKLEEAEVRRKTRDTKEKKQKILAIIAKKQDQKLEESSVEDLQAMVEAL
jgi:hypothetical protein